MRRMRGDTHGLLNTAGEDSHGHLLRGSEPSLGKQHRGLERPSLGNSRRAEFRPKYEKQVWGGPL